VNERAPTFEEFLVHAKLFGCELVVETAARLLPEPDLARLRVEIDLLVRRSSRRGSRLPRRRRTAAETLVACAALRAEGLAHGYIAEKLGISEKRVRELLARDRRSRKASVRPQRGNQFPDLDSNGPDSAWLGGEITSETGNAANDLGEPSQAQIGGTEGLREEPLAGGEAGG
jgi:hypothetical protein